MDFLQSLSLPPTLYLLAYSFPAILIGIAFTCFTSPDDAAEIMGFEITEKSRPYPLWYTFGMRELTIGISIWIMMACDQWKAATITMGCHGLSGLGDFYIDGTWGQGSWVVWQLAHEQQW
ncbi:uncharacterized protein AB675_8244 [Cyphellophora attinorum]|uniref:Uncharacterized protein n=1 Tax=Cyphellophora attinorum TaxID=1664694 RepID=A0A0N1HAA3_9EURO|nr:uncharacterized protein AB675_8244 [Phialophora attinorum]KPI44755.1 hypothetical protein AB675_8244 [Phialophora attinorum]